MAVKIEGVRELHEAIKSIKVDDPVRGAAILRRITYAGGAVLRSEARAVAEGAGLRKTGDMIKNIVIKRERNAPPGTEQYNLGVRYGRDLGNGKKVVKYLEVGKSGRVITKRLNDPFYWKFVHFGTKYIQGVRFLEIALKNKAQAAIDAMTTKAQKELLKANK